MVKTLTIDDLINAHWERKRIEIHTTLPARVVSFNAADNTVQVEVMINQVLKDGEPSELPLLVDVPVQFPRGGGFVLTFPISSGDEGLVVFSERCIDGWWQTGEKAVPMEKRIHDYSDAFFIPGVSSVPNAVPDIAMDGVSMRTVDNSTFIKVTNGKIIIKGDIEQEGNYQQEGNMNRMGTSTTTGLISGAGGLSIEGDNGTGSSATIKGNLTHTGGTITSLGRKIDGTHVHSVPTGGNTGAPQ